MPDMFRKVGRRHAMVVRVASALGIVHEIVDEVVDEVASGCHPPKKKGLATKARPESIMIIP